MGELTRINADQLQLPPQCEEFSLAKTSGERLPDELVVTLGFLMAQTQARFANQVLPEGTPDMYLVEWEEMVVKYGMKDFRDALLTVIRDRKRPQFFPQPDELHLKIRAVRAASADRAWLRQFDHDKAVWERERAEDIANGIPRKSAEEEIVDLISSAKPAEAEPTRLVGWTAAQLREAAEKLERGESVVIPATGTDAYERNLETAREFRRQHGITNEMMTAARDRMMAANNPENNPVTMPSQC